MKIIGYARVSTQEQARGGLSLDVQEQMIRDYCALHHLDLDRVLVDAGVSGGKALSTRPRGRELLDLVDERNTAVVSVKLDRLFRSASDCLDVVQRWDRVGAALHLVSQGGTSIDTQSAMGRFLITIMAGVAEMERNLTRERVRDTLAHKQTRGERTGTIPYGYRMGLGQQLEPDEAEMHVLRSIMTQRARGLSYARIAALLNEQQVQARGNRWHKTSVVRLIQRETSGWRPELKGTS